MELPQWLTDKESACNAGEAGDRGLVSESERSPGGGNGRQLTLVFLPGKSHGERSLAGYSPLGHKELEKIKHTHTCSLPYPEGQIKPVSKED